MFNYGYSSYQSATQKCLPAPQAPRPPAVIRDFNSYLQNTKKFEDKAPVNPNLIADYIITMSILADAAKNYQIQKLQSEMEIFALHQELKQMAIVQTANALLAYQSNINYAMHRQSSSRYYD